MKAETNTPFFHNSTIPFKTQNPLSRITSLAFCHNGFINRNSIPTVFPKSEKHLVAVDLTCLRLQRSTSGTTPVSNHRQSYVICFQTTMSLLGRTWSWGMCTCSETLTFTRTDTRTKLVWIFCPCSRSTHRWVFSIPISDTCRCEEFCMCTWGLMW